MNDQQIINLAFILAVLSGLIILLIVIAVVNNDRLTKLESQIQPKVECHNETVKVSNWTSEACDRYNDKLSQCEGRTAWVTYEVCE